MEKFVVKIKGKDLFFNADEIGEYISDSPLLLDSDQAKSIVTYCEEVWDLDGINKYTNSDLEIRQAKITIL